MRGKLMFLGGMAVGFVLGARAGRERYEQLLSKARELRDHPTVQEAAGVVQAQANRLYSEGKDAVNDKLGSTRGGEGHRPAGDPLAEVNEQDPLTGSTRPPGTTF